MTNRNRRFSGRPTRRTSGRHGRLVWVNADVNEIPVAGILGIRDLLTAADAFMTFDTTIITTIIESMSHTYNSVAPAGTRSARVALQTGPVASFASNFASLFVNSIGPPWMYLASEVHNITGVQVQELDLVPNPPTVVKSKRRFKENNNTLWLIHQTVHPAADTNLQLLGYVRTLLRIP